MRKSRIRDFESFIWYDLFMFESKKMVLPILFILFAVSGCSTCSEKVVVPLVEKVPADATLVVEITDTQDALRGFGLYVEQISRGTARPLVKRLRAALETQAGVQIFKPKAWRSAGIALERGMVLFIREDQKMIFLKSSNPELLEKALARLVTRLDGATKKVLSDHGGVSVVTLGRPFGTEVVPVLHYAKAGDTFLLSLGGEPSLVASTLSPSAKDLKVSRRWVDDPLISSLTKKVAKRSMRMVGRSELAQRLVGEEAKQLSKGAAIGLDWGPTGIELDGFVDFQVQGLEKLFPSSSVLEHARLVEADGALIVLTDAARPEIFKMLRSQPMFKQVLASVQSRSLQETGLDIEAEVLKHLEGPVALAIHLQDISTLYKRLAAGERRVKVLLDSLQVALVAKVANAEAMQATLDRSFAALVKRGVSLRKRDFQVADILVSQFEPDKAAPRMGWGLVKNYYYYGAGLGRAEKVARHLLDKQGEGALAAMKKSVASVLAKEPGNQVVTLRSEVVSEALGLLLKQTKIPAMAKLGLTQQADMILALLAGMDDISLSVNSEPQTVVLKVRQRL